MFLQKVLLYLSTACMFCYMLGLFLMLAILQFFSPSLAKKFILRMGEKITMTQNPRFNYEDWGLTFMSLAFIKTASFHMWCVKETQTRLLLCDASLRQHCRFSAGNRALFKQLVKDFSDVADFLVIYIAEAHSTDGWAFKNNYDINQHQSLEDRLSAAQVLVQSEPLCPVVVDEMTDVTTIKYGALPERLYVLQAGKVLYKVRQVQNRQFLE
uniref:Iodothyronine deiodinase n=1 Tax=Neolamprologus brichardi TaxID=32507 RepID=A0A3Q4MQW8_NEOBR